jgi:hypothetical protein
MPYTVKMAYGHTGEPVDPAIIVDLDDYTTPSDKLWVLRGLYGVSAIVCARCEGDAIDAAMDANLLGQFSTDDDDNDEMYHAGNNGAPIDTTYLRIFPLNYDSHTRVFSVK